jgi:hypothetical protein
MHWSSPLIAVMLIILWAGGCAATKALLPLTNVQVQDDGASVASFKAPISRLDYDLWRASRDRGWAMHYPIKPDDDGHYRGKSLIPDGRCLLVEGWPDETDHKRFFVKVKIGHYGDQPRQANYLAQLKMILAGKPMPKRGLNFSLDDDAKNEQ